MIIPLTVRRDSEDLEKWLFTRCGPDERRLAHDHFILPVAYQGYGGSCTGAGYHVDCLSCHKWVK